MKNKQVIVITAKNEFDLVEAINNDRRDFFATQPKQKIDGTWVCFCYYSSFQESTIKKDELATEKQVEYICKHNIDANTENLTKKQASDIIAKHIIEMNKKEKAK